MCIVSLPFIDSNKFESLCKRPDRLTGKESLVKSRKKTEERQRQACTGCKIHSANCLMATHRPGFTLCFVFFPIICLCHRDYSLNLDFTVCIEDTDTEKCSVPNVKKTRRGRRQRAKLEMLTDAGTLFYSNTQTLGIHLFINFCLE